MTLGFAFFLNSVLFGVGLAMDAFSVSVANAIADPDMKHAQRLRIAGCFALFQILMPLLGWLCVRTIAESFTAFQKFIPWIALGLLLYIGGKMLLEGVRGRAEEEAEEKRALGHGTLLLQGVATSIDALSVGFTIEEYPFSAALIESLIIGAADHRRGHARDLPLRALPRPHDRPEARPHRADPRGTHPHRHRRRDLPDGHFLKTKRTQALSARTRPVFLFIFLTRFLFGAGLFPDAAHEQQHGEQRGGRAQRQKDGPGICADGKAHQRVESVQDQQRDRREREHDHKVREDADQAVQGSGTSLSSAASSTGGS